MDRRVDEGRVCTVPPLCLCAVDHQNSEPAKRNQKHGNVNVVNEETRLPRPLETPMHIVSAEKRTGNRRQLPFFLAYLALPLFCLIF
jgi:hypothetical protein